ncbi:MAG: hypothetical protein QW818_01615 [Candidatus Aenigmatarchaeota archaeon]|nr:hypothetical protein [Candidatus Aenigmarchaeota archaeon]
MLFTKLKEKDRLATIENYCILFIFLGSITLSLGIGLTVVNTKGIPVILAMIGALISFLSTVALIFTWLIRELFSR